MNISQEHVDLRRQLDAITTHPLEIHPQLIATLHHHTIVLADAESPAETPLGKFTCFMHAFDLTGSALIRKISSACENTYPGPDFVWHLVHCHLTEVSQADSRDGDVLIYSSSEIKHAGKLRAGRVLSKWGNGHLWEHAVAEVPSRYGEMIRFYRAPRPGLVEEAFEAYARKREGSDLIDLLLT